MEQQPGPVNWAPHNPAPLPGMVRLWTWEAIAHQAETVCYFRWRQAPFAQEQMHAGLLLPDSTDSETFSEVVRVAEELQGIGSIEPARSDVAMIFDYESCWAWETQPQGENFDYFALNLAFYRGLRRLGLSVDIVPSTSTDFSGRRLLLIAGLMHWPDRLLEALENYSGATLIGPRSGSKTKDFRIPPDLPPGIPNLDCRVRYVESLRTGAIRELAHGGYIHSWLESLESGERIIEESSEGKPVLVTNDTLHYLAGWPDDHALIKRLCDTQNIETVEMPEGVRLRDTASHRFVINYNNHAVEFDGKKIDAAGVRWQLR